MDGNEAHAGGAAAAAAAQQPEQEAAAAPPAAGVTMKQRKNRGNIRKRDTTDSATPAAAGGAAAAGEEEDTTTVVRKAKQARGDPLAFSTKQDRKQDLAVTYAGTAEALAAKDESATRHLETETQFDRDARAQRERLLAASTTQQGADGEAPAQQEKATYKGMNAYVDYKAGFRREGHTVGAEKGSGSHGPLRGNVFVRSTARFDYQPDICKDYKETGFCSYGDSCKFMHDRGDYKSGWELDRDWDEEQKRRQEALTKGWNPDGDSEQEEDEDRDDGLPFACYICRELWAECKSDPVVTKCKHYFCETCAIKHNMKTGKCAACDQPTQGIFNVATDILKKMKQANAS